MLALLETAAGFALFRVKKGKLLQVEDVEELYENFKTAETARKCVELHAFSRFKDNKQATEEVLALADAKLGKGLHKFLKKNLLKGEEAASLIVGDKALGAAVKRQLNIDVIFSPQTHELLRGIKQHISSLIGGLEDKGMHYIYIYIFV